ncbi:hypothetical protein L208DRAFT_1425812 [Tricholoma matsutake]|nr:hypothetical protein L208DRAFT_1425812 [Tricholoma matsutake 945]
MVHLCNVYPVDLQRLICLNWLCNPTGKLHAFHAVDWLVERNNLYTKVIYGGSGSNHTMELIIKEGFHLKHQTIWHQHPNMTKTLQKLRQAINDNSLHSFTPGQNADTVVPDKISVAMDIMQKKKNQD